TNVPMEVVNAAFSANEEQVISEVVRTDSSLEIIYVTNVGMLEGENPMREVYRLIFVQSQVPTEAEVNAARERNAELASMANGMSSAEDFSAMAQELADANEEVSYADRGYVNKEALNDMGESVF